MKTRGSWVKVAKFVGVTGLVCGLLMVAAFRSARKRSPQTGAGRSQVAASQASKISATKGDPKWSEAYGKLPLSFEENQGQTAREVRYVSHGSGYELFLTSQEAVLALRSKVPRDLSPLRRTATLRALRKARRAGQSTAIRMQLEGANPDAKIAGMDQLPGKTNYFIGNDPKNWHTDVPSYARVKYAGVYPGVDLVFYGNQRRLEYDFVVAPGADPKVIAMKVDGARKMCVNSRGDLVLSVAGGEVELQKPVVYQNVKGERREIAGGYAIDRNRRVTFAVGSYDRTEPLILDPVLNYSTYLGGSAGDVGFAIAVDGSGNAFIAGETMSTDFPAGTKVAFGTGPTPNLGASFVAELDPTGTKLLYSTYLAGTASNRFESANAIAVDSGGKIYVTGGTFATDFPMPTTPNGFKSGSNPGNVNGTSYIAKLDPTVSGAASLLYSSYIGGTNGTALFGGDFGEAIAVDANGIAYVAGYTDSTASTTVTSMPNFPVVNGFQTTLNSTNGNAFLAKIDTTKSGSASLIYSTYVGGAGANALVAGGLGFGEEAFGVAIGASGNAYLAGQTSSTDFPTFGNAYQPNRPAGNTKATAFVTQIDTTKIGPLSKNYSTYLGGATFDLAYAISLGPGNVAYVTGTTNSNDFPVTPKPGAFDTSGAAGGKAFVSLIDTTQAAVPSLKYSTFLGGTGVDTGFGIRADAQGNAYVAGTTSSLNFPFPPKGMIVGGFEPTYPPGAPSVGFIAKLSPAGNNAADLLYSTYFGGNGNAPNGDHIFAIAIDTSNPANAYVTGQTYSTAATFPVFPKTAPTAFQTTLNGTSDGFVAKLTPIATLTVAPTSLDFGTILIPNTSPAQTVTLTNNTNAAIAFASAVVNGNPAAANTDYKVTNSCSGSIPFGATNTCTVSVTFKPTVVGAETATLQLTDSDSTSPQLISLTGSGTNTPPDFGLTGPTSVQNVTDGSTLNFNVTVTGVGGFSSPVALACTGAPALATCTIPSSPVTPPVAPPSSVQAQVSMTTTAMVVPPPRVPTLPMSIRQVVPLILALVLLFLLPRTQQLRTRFAMVTAMMLFVVLAGCSGPAKPHTPKGAATLTITGTSGALTHTVQVQISVN
ncbi:MAG TPA: SBBP repeat-containing protein [Candidatus Acidoferrum sp.]|nr:SBBP repeat-containing protein [Candidatus Acidoferrum sp.]